jgi:hypothetical protein
MAIDDDASPADLRRLLDVAVWSAAQGRWKDAEAICDGVRAVRPNEIEPMLAEAFIDLSADRLSKAAKTLEAVIARQPDVELAKAMLVVVRSRQGLMHDARRWADESAKASDPFAAAVAEEFYARGTIL